MKIHSFLASIILVTGLSNCSDGDFSGDAGTRRADPKPKDDVPEVQPDEELEEDSGSNWAPRPDSPAEVQAEEAEPVRSEPAVQKVADMVEVEEVLLPQLDVKSYNITGGELKEGFRLDASAFETQVPVRTFLADAPTIANGAATVNIPAAGVSQWFVISYRGWIKIPVAETYSFATKSDDGSNLYIDGVRLVDNDGAHGIQIRASQGVSLTAGLHAFRVDVFNRRGEVALEVLWKSSATTAHETLTGANLGRKP